MPCSLVPGFRPSTSGLHFANVFPRQPVLTVQVPGFGRMPIGDASRGLCGGMAFTVRDFFEARRPPAADSVPPAAGSPLYRYIVRRLFDSFHLPRGPLRYYRWMTLSDEQLRRRTAEREWPRVRADLDRGRLVSLGLVKLRSANPLVMGDNHQVLAYGYDLDDARCRLFLYDPNYPDEDELMMTIELVGGAVHYSTGGVVRGFFRTPYRPARGCVRLTANAS